MLHYLTLGHRESSEKSERNLSPIFSLHKKKTNIKIHYIIYLIFLNKSFKKYMYIHFNNIWIKNFPISNSLLTAFYKCISFLTWEFVPTIPHHRTSDPAQVDCTPAFCSEWTSVCCTQCTAPHTQLYCDGTETRLPGWVTPCWPHTRSQTVCR